MTYQISITEDNIFTAVRNWLITCLNGEMVQGWTNRVSTPAGDFVVMSGLVKEVLSSNTRLYEDPVDPEATGFQVNKQSVDYHIQLDVYGPSAGDSASILSAAFHSDRAYPFFAAQTPPGIAPLYMEDPKQSPIVTGEQQYDQRWTMVIHLQFKPAITDVQEFADELSVSGIISVDAEYPV